jgi:hypothetical protein
VRLQTFKDPLATIKKNLIIGWNVSESMPGSEIEEVGPEAKESLSRICWVATAILAAFTCFTQAGMMLSLLAGHIGVPAIAPVCLGLALLSGNWLSRRMGLAGRMRLWPVLVAVGVLAISLATSAWYFDLSWDGQWYHQTAIYAIARDWNPLTDPMREFLQHLQLWVRHYAKGPWYVAAAIYQTTGNIELGKCTAPIAGAAMGLAVFAAGLDWGLKRWKAGLVALVVAMNPVVMSELTTYLVDGIMIGYLVVAVAAVFSGFKRPQLAVILVGMLGTIASINAKFTGLVFLCFVFAAGWLWCAVLHREWLLRYTGCTALSLLLGTVVFGYNPYVTNTIHRQQPFYPVLGSRAFPSLTEQGREGIELYETPKNLRGHSRFYRLAYATFGRPGNQPYRREPNAQLMWPFAARPADLFYYKYHEARVAGFGPFFSGAILIAMGLWILLLFQRSKARWAATLAVITIVLSLSISLHLWWPRYGPQLWLLPIVPAAFVIWQARSRMALGVSWGLLSLLLVNAGIVAAVRMSWETDATFTLRHQLADLSQPGRHVEITLGHFQIPVGERLKTWGINFQDKGGKERVRDGAELKSVVEGYPGAVRYRLVSGDPMAQPPLQNR